MYTKHKMFLLQSIDVHPNLLGVSFCLFSCLNPKHCCENLKSCLFVHTCR
jgi:hypothetical protein